MVQCIAYTAKGTRCSLMTYGKSNYCHLHDPVGKFQLSKSGTVQLRLM